MEAVCLRSSMRSLNYAIKKKNVGNFANKEFFNALNC